MNSTVVSSHHVDTNHYSSSKRMSCLFEGRRTNNRCGATNSDVYSNFDNDDNNYDNDVTDYNSSSSTESSLSSSPLKKSEMMTTFQTKKVEANVDVDGVNERAYCSRPCVGEVSAMFATPTVLKSVIVSEEETENDTLFQSQEEEDNNVVSFARRKRRRSSVLFVPNSTLLSDVAFPKNNDSQIIPIKKKSKKIMNRKDNSKLWYTPQEMHHIKNSFICDVKRYENCNRNDNGVDLDLDLNRPSSSSSSSSSLLDENEDNDYDYDDLPSIDRYTKRNRRRRRNRRNGMVQICKAVHEFERIIKTKVPPEMLSELLQRYSNT